MKSYKVIVNDKHYFVKAKDSVEAVKKVEKMQDGGFQETGNYWRNLESKNPGIEKIYKEFQNTPTFQNWGMKNSMDIIYSEEMFPKFMQFYKQKTGKEIRDERLSPMTYRKLKEYGYNHNQWKNLSQEQANKIVAQHEQKNKNTQSKKSENTQNKQTKSFLRFQDFF